MLSEPSIRPAEPADAEALTALMIDTFRDTYRADRFGDCRPADVEAYVAESFTPARQAAELVDPMLRTVLVEGDGRLAGYAQIRLDARSTVVAGGDPVELARFYVHRDWHGRGLAMRLMRACLSAAPHADPFWLNVYKRNARAVAFYAKCGFVPVGTAPFRMGDDVQDDWILARYPDSPLP
jgi:diamine N-acetyltransferase